MRSLNELLILVRDRIQNNELELGICWEIQILRYNDIITYEEKEKLSIFIVNNRPKRGKHYDKNMKNSGFWWTEGQKEPRIAWLNSKIRVV